MPVSAAAPSAAFAMLAAERASGPNPVITYAPTTYINVGTVYDDGWRPVPSLPAMTYGAVPSAPSAPWYESVPGGTTFVDWWTGGDASRAQATRPVGHDIGSAALSGEEAKNVELYQHGGRQGAPPRAWPWVLIGTTAVVGIGLAVGAGVQRRRRASSRRRGR